MEDIEKNRVEYVTRLEQQLKHAQELIAQLRPVAEKWEPKVVAGSLRTADQQVSITLAFGGKQQTMSVRFEAMQTTSTSDLSAYVARALAETFVAPQLAKLLSPEIERLQRGVAGLKSTL